MSTVPEAIVARHMGVEVLGISCITNAAAGVLPQPLNHDEVMEVARQVRGLPPGPLGKGGGLGIEPAPRRYGEAGLQFSGAWSVWRSLTASTARNELQRERRMGVEPT